MRSFALGGPSAYLKLFEAYVLPIVMYASPVWNPTRKGDIKKLQKLVRRFLRTVEYRYRFPRSELETVHIVDRLRKIDMRVFRGLIRNEPVFDEFFTLRYSRTRSGFSLNAHSAPRSVGL